MYPRRFTEAGALTATVNPGYSINDYQDEFQSNYTNEEDDEEDLFETLSPPQVEFKATYRLETSAKTHVEFMNKLHKTIKRAAAYSSAPSLQLSLVGATGNKFMNTNELHVLTNWEAIASDDKERLLEAVEDEFRRFIELKVFKLISQCLLPRWVKVLSTVGACKRKARLNMRGFEQIPKIHFRPEWTSAPVTSAMTIGIMLIMLLMREGYAHIIYICIPARFILRK